MTGINNNSHQIGRAQQITADSGKFVAERCSFVQSDFMKLPFADASYDHAYAIEATCHAPDPVACYKEIARCIKPGGMFVCYEWVRSNSVATQNRHSQSSNQRQQSHVPAAVLKRRACHACQACIVNARSACSV